jgi:hypothetical protein
MAYDEALARVSAQLLRIGRQGVIREPWLGDETSRDLHEAYNKLVMEASEGPYAALVAYQAELMRVRDQLQMIEDAYRRMEGDNAALWRGGRE